MSETALEPFLRSTRVVDWQDSRVLAQARLLGTLSGCRDLRAFVAHLPTPSYWTIPMSIQPMT